MVSAIIPALNEEKTVAAAVLAAKECSLVGEVIVVDDGSEDATAALARAAGARVIRMKHNGGKAAAMAEGVAAAKGEFILFVDADLEGLTSAHLDSLIRPVVSDKFGMYVGICGRKQLWLTRILRFLPLWSGTRALTREVWESVPAEFKKRFQIEVALNYFCRHVARRRLGSRLLPRVRNTIKEKKWGVAAGFWHRLRMLADLGWITVRLYFLRDLK